MTRFSLLRALRLNRQRRWQTLWRGVCQRAPNLCRLLELGRKIIFRFDPEVLEAQIAALALSVAIRWVFRALHIGDASSVTQLLICLLPLWAWAILFGMMGTAHIIGLMTNCLRWRASSAMLGVFTWSFVSVLMMLDGLTGPGTVLFSIIALSEAWVYLRLTACCFDSPDRGEFSRDET